MTGSKPGEIFDHITNLLEDFENEDAALEKSNINSEKSTEDAFHTVIKVKFLNLNSIGFQAAKRISKRINALKVRSGSATITDSSSTSN